MSEYQQVEKPFLDQLATLGWEVIDHGECLPTTPVSSLRTDFREVALKSVFFSAVRYINRDADGSEWLTDTDLETLFSLVTGQSGSLTEVNKRVHELLLKGVPVVRQTSNGPESVTVKLLDFDAPETNRFHAINQFRIDTPGQAKGHIRLDIALFVNGLPLVVIEAKEANAFTSLPMQEAKKQLMRYTERRDESTKGGVKEGEERLFHTNLFLIATTGSEACYGSITTDPDDFQRWKSITPPKYATFNPPLGGKARGQETLIQGMLPRDTLLDLLQNFTLFTTKRDQLIKIVPRYQQYRAVLNALERIRNNTGMKRGGVIWHTQGSGKSLTMVFFVRKLRSSPDLYDFKVVMVNDRTDLEEQLEGTVQLTGEKVTRIGNSADLKSEMAGNDSGLYLVMVHKFREAVEQLSPALKAALGIPVAAPKVKPFPQVNTSARIIVFVDEAHRTQYSDLGDNLANAFPNAVKIAFTGTPLMTKRHKQTTLQRFGDYIDTYKLREAQDDEAVLPIIYVGKTTDTAISHKSEFDEKFEDMFADRTEEEVEAIKKKYGGRDDILDAEARIKDIAKDLTKHYIENVLPDGFKAQVVSNSKLAALRYDEFIKDALEAFATRYEKKPDHDPEFLKSIRFLKSAVVVSSEGTNELAGVIEARKQAKELDAINNFLKRFNFEEPETGVAFLNVCDMLLTGFDAPIEQVMYLDKPLKEHTLLQAIARVNRRAPGKKVGIIVDYIGLTKHLREALDIYSGEDIDEFMSCFRSLDDEYAKLQGTFERIMFFFREHKIEQCYDWCAQKLGPEDDYLVFELIMDVIKDPKSRETFDVLLTLFLQAMNSVLPDARAMEFSSAAKRLAWLKGQARERYKDNSMDLGNAGEKVKRLINEHLVSLGVNPKIPPVELLQANFISNLDKKPTKAKASEMEHALRKHITVHMEEDPAFFGPLSEKLEEVIRKYKENWDEQAKQLTILVEEAKAGRKKSPTDGVEPKAVPFYEHLVMLADKEAKLQPAEKNSLKSLTNDLLPLFATFLVSPGFWNNPVRVDDLQSEVYTRLVDSGIDTVIDHVDEWSKAIVQLAKARHNDLMS